MRYTTKLILIIIVFAVLFLIIYSCVKSDCGKNYYEWKKGECCLDMNNNKVCDGDEGYVAPPTTTTTETTTDTTAAAVVDTTTSTEPTTETTTTTKILCEYYAVSAVEENITYDADNNKLKITVKNTGTVDADVSILVDGTAKALTGKTVQAGDKKKFTITQSSAPLFVTVTIENECEGTKPSIRYMQPDDGWKTPAGGFTKSDRVYLEVKGATEYGVINSVKGNFVAIKLEIQRPGEARTELYLDELCPSADSCDYAMYVKGDKYTTLKTIYGKDTDKEDDLIVYLCTLDDDDCFEELYEEEDSAKVSVEVYRHVADGKILASGYKDIDMTDLKDVDLYD